MPNFTIAFPAMGTQIQAWLNVPQGAQANLLRQVPLWFEAWETRFSRFRPLSELCALNSCAGEWVALSAEMSEVIELSLHAAADTDGLFNPLVLPALESAGYDHSFVGRPGRFVPGPVRPAPERVADWRAIRFDARRKRLQLPAGGRIDLGGIVKGWAAQKTADRLAEFGPCLVNAGGDIAAHGSPDDSGGWRVAIPRQRDTLETLCTITLRDSAIATSGIDHRRWERDGRILHHLIDPRTGQPASSDALTATVIAPTAAEAETWAKAAFISADCEVTACMGYPALIVHGDLSISYNTAFEALCPTFAHNPSNAAPAK